jgi:hypothetical protein
MRQYRMRQPGAPRHLERRTDPSTGKELIWDETVGRWCLLTVVAADDTMVSQHDEETTSS